MNDVLVSAREFAAIQSALLTLLDKAYPFLALGDLDRLPKTGTIAALGGVWTFKRHGAGVKFVSADEVVVDAHRAVRAVGGIDAWRLARYMSSLQKSEVSHRDVEKALSEISRAGGLRLSGEDKEIYELRDKGAE